MSIHALYLYMYYLEPEVQYKFPLKLTKNFASFRLDGDLVYQPLSSYYTILDLQQQWKIMLQIKHYAPNAKFTFELSNIINTDTLETYLSRSVTSNEYGEATIDVIVKKDSDSTFTPDNYAFNFLDENDTQNAYSLYNAEISLLITKDI